MQYRKVRKSLAVSCKKILFTHMVIETNKIYIAITVTTGMGHEKKAVEMKRGLTINKHT